MSTGPGRLYGYSYREAVLKAFNNEETFATTLFAIALDMFGAAEFAGWDPETIAIEFESLTGVPWEKIPAVSRDKLMMMTGLVTSDSFFRQLEVFIATCNAFCGAEVDVRTFDPATMEEMAWTVTEARLMGYEDEFRPEIKAYVAVQAQLEGYESLPPSLSWGDPPKKAEKAAEAVVEGGTDMFAAGYSANRDSIAELEDGVRMKASLLTQELAEFPFIHREQEQA